MHLTGGQYKGFIVEVPKNVKPTLSKVRESVFNILASHFQDIENLTFLDMFAGSGIMSMEAQSRGMEVLSIEKNPKNASIIKNNYKKYGIKPNIIVGDSIKYLKNSDLSFDVIYIDPPWTDTEFQYDYNEILELAHSKLNEKGILIFESEKIKKLPHQEFSLVQKLIREKVYGRCMLSFFKA